MKHRSSISTISDKVKTLNWFIRAVSKGSEEDGGRKRWWWYETFSVVAVCSSCISCGNLLGYTSSSVPSMHLDNTTFPLLQYYHVSLIGGLGPLGAVFGALLSTFLLRLFGSRRTIAFFAIPISFTSWTTIGFSTGLVPVLCGRFLGGIGVGAIIASAPLYVIDICSLTSRGKMGIMPQFLMIAGILISYCLGAFLDWRNLAFATVGFVVLSGVLIIFAPDTPKWLIVNGRTNDAFEILTRLCGSQEAKLVLERIELALTTTSKDINKVTWDMKAYKSILVCLGLMSIQQFTGINGVTFFAATIFNASGTFSNGQFPSIIIASTQLLASFLSTLFIERFGRTFLLKFSTTAITISGTILGTYFYCFTEYPSLFWVPVTALILFAFGFAIGIGPVTWILVVEILPQEIRNLINPLIISYNWLCVATVTASFPWLTERIHYYGIFWIYAATAALGLAFVCLFIPETKGKTSEEIQDYFAKKKTTRTQEEIC